jgi:hypothetical protein
MRTDIQTPRAAVPRRQHVVPPRDTQAIDPGETRSSTLRPQTDSPAQARSSSLGSASRASTGAAVADASVGRAVDMGARGGRCGTRHVNPGPTACATSVQTSCLRKDEPIVNIGLAFARFIRFDVALIGRAGEFQCRHGFWRLARLHGVIDVRDDVLGLLAIQEVAERLRLAESTTRGSTDRGWSW